MTGALLKKVERSATVAFCPQSGLLAAGTVAGAIDDAFSTNSVLEVFSLDFGANSETLPVVGKVQASERFYRLAWGSKLPGSASHGLLAGGLADGSVMLWDPSLIVEKKPDGGPPLLAKMQKHKGEVKGLEFNTFSPNLLASGAADGELCIWDLAKPTAPTLYPALKGGTAPGAVGGGNEITFISWNRKVQHILASSATNGTTVVWDLKRQKPVISLRDPNSHRRASVLQWNPEVATQLVVASDDDRSPTLQMWDLRNSVSPLKEFVGHTKGVLGMAWSPHDPTLLLSSGKDNRTICWDVLTSDTLCELPASTNWNFDVQWCPTVAGVFSTSSFDGHVGICNLLACTVSKTTDTFDPNTFTHTSQATGETVPLKRAPTWMRRPCGVSFGFGGRLVSFTHNKVSTQDTAGNVHVRDNGVVHMSQVVTEFDLIQRSEAFEQAIAGGDKNTLQGYCQTKAQGTEGDEAETWSFLGLLYEQDGRRELLRKLGFQDIVQAEPPPPEANGNASVTSPNGDAALAAATSGVDRLTVDAMGRSVSQGGQPEDFFGNQDASDFFENLQEAPQDASARASATGEVRAAGSTRGSVDGNPPAAGVTELPPNHVDASTEHEEEIQRAMIAGNYEAAVETCFKANRLADALLIANIFNSDLFKRTMQRYMKRCPKPYMQIVKASVEQDFETLVRTRPVGQWRETLALLATYTAQEDWAQLCDVLATRLNQAGMHHAASLCYICAGNVDQAVAYWSKSVQQLQAAAAAGRTPPAKAAEGVQALQGVIEKAVLFGLATGNKKASSSLSELVTKYASILAAQGRMHTALEYLDYVPGEASTTVAVLKDRIFRSGQGGIPPGTHAPPFPFVREDVKQGGDQAQYGAAKATTAHGVQQQQQAQHQHQTYAAQPAQSSYPAYSQPAAVTGGGYAAQPTQPAYPAYTASAHTAPAQPAHNAYNTGYGAATNTYGDNSAYNMHQPASASNAYGQQPADAGGAAVWQPKRTSGPTASQPTAFMPTTTAHPPVPVGTYSQPAVPAAPPPAAPSAPSAPKPHAFAPTVSNPSAVPVPPVAPVSTPNYPPNAWGAPPAPTGAPPAPGGGMTMPGMAPGMPGMPGGMAGGAPGMAAPPPKPAAPPPPPGPPANVSVVNVDTAKVPAEQRAIVNSLTGLFNACAPLANNPAKKREMDDNSRKLGQLLWKLNNGDVSEGVIPKLLQLCQAIDTADWHTANHIQVQMTTTDWEECGFWLSAVKRLIKLRQQGS